RQARGRSTSPAEFAAHALDILQVRFELDERQLERIPRTGPAVVVANHPYGGLEGLFLIAQLQRYRSDSLFIANELLARIPEIREVLLPVDAFGGPRAASKNAKSLRAALKHVRSGGLLVLFPAGAVSHLHLSAGRVCDPPWQPVAAGLLRRCESPVVPVYFGGGNSAIFQALGLLHPTMRTVMLTRELLNKRHRTIPVRVGRPIGPERLAKQPDNAKLASFLRLSTYALEARSRSAVEEVTPAPSVPVAASTPARLLTAEIECLPEGNTLASVADMSVVFAQAEQIPWTLRELGRLREITFRAVGEGTGSDSDIDRYDRHYVHLIAWHRTRNEVVGAYRIGHVDRIVAERGKRGLYTHSLFAYGDPFLRSLGPALELGRSFVSAAYQRDFGALLLLWKGIAQYVACNPRYHVLFGPVSISREYRPASHALLIDFLRRHCFDAQLARLIKPRRAFRRTHSLAALNGDLARLADLDDVSQLLEEIEPDGKGAPVLLRQYLKLGGRLACFNVDETFSGVVDGLIVVDLLRTEPKVLQKYMGREQAAAFIQYAREQPRALADTHAVS
ncbi:MAG TPA: GNAT family N-acyltransferase, partial [Steroidobacteraceae bacterium]|nr:GNAT family N-acyltransferase [Steroidobacteraceae bacterium]